MSNALTPEEKLRVLRAERTPSPPTRPDLLAEASTAETVMQHERLLRKISLDKLAQRTGIPRLRLIRLENGGQAVKPTLGEKVALEQAFRDNADVLLAPLTRENLTKLRKLI